MSLLADAELWRACGSSPAVESGLQGAVRILAGDDDALRNAANGWVEALVGLLANAYPAAAAQVGWVGAPALVTGWGGRRSVRGGA